MNRRCGKATSRVQFLSLAKKISRDSYLNSWVNCQQALVKRLQRWVIYVETMGLIKARKIPGLHDEPLRGKWKGYRSVRLSKSWRAIYKHKKNGDLHIASVEEITNHDYK